MRKIVAALVMCSICAPAHAEDFRAECVQSLSIIQRGKFVPEARTFQWQQENAFRADDQLAYLVLIDLPDRNIEWIDLFSAVARTSTFEGQQENSFSIVEGGAEVSVIGERLSIRVLNEPSTEWTFEFDGQGRAQLRRTSSNSTFEGAMIVVDQADCTLTGKAPVLLRSKDSKPSEEFAEKFWRDAETSIFESGKKPTLELQHRED